MSQHANGADFNPQARRVRAVSWLGVALSLGFLAPSCSDSSTPLAGPTAGTLGSGGSVGCPAGQLACAAGCVDPSTNALNCGNCGVACDSAQTCAGGMCQCSVGFANCSGTCVSLLSDALNCGVCAAACAPGMVCSQGACASSCALGLMQCGANCVDITSSITDCGGCGQLCGGGQSCAGGACVCAAGQTACTGACVDTQSDPSNCGACGQACAVGATCAFGFCQGGTLTTTGGATLTTAGGAAAPTSMGGSGGTGGDGGVGGASAGGSGTASGGAVGTGGMAGTGGASTQSTTSATMTTGGTGGTGSSACSSEPVGSCSSPEVRITEVNLGTSVISGTNEGDTAPIPFAIAAMPTGGSRLAALGTDGRVHVAELDCEDQLVGTPFSFPVNDFQDIAADENGGVIAVTRDAEGGGTLNCGNENNLCIAPNDPIPCYDMLLLRFDTAGNEVWATKLTTASAQNPPYSAGGGANHFIWWYQHHTRLAYDGTNYAAYFCDAITIQNGSCVDIHEGDRMQVVGPNGAIVNHPDAFAGGCSHSWNTRIVWDDRSGEFVMVCATDNNNRVARPAPYRTILSTPDIGTTHVGGLVLGSSGGYWVSVSYQGTIRLLHFDEATPDQNISVGSSGFSHLVSYGADNMIVAWESGGGMAAQVRSSNDGAAVSSQFAVSVPDHRYQAFKAFPDGSAAYAAQGTNNQSVRIARVLPCAD